MLPVIALRCILGSQAMIEDDILTSRDFSHEAWTIDQPEHPASHPLVEKLVTETHATALLTAAVTSAINAFRQRTLSTVAAELHAYIPNPAGMKFGLDLMARDSHISIAAREALLVFFGHLEPCLEEMERYFADCKDLGVERAAALHQLSLANSWRLVCHSASDAIQELAIETEDRLPDLYNLSTGILQRLLNAAARGQSPCINADGQTYLPALPQRRRGARRLLHQPATIETLEYSGHIFVRDVSQGGLGLERARRIKEGDHATITLVSGRQFRGTVVWRKGARAGLQLSTPLSPQDPMLWG